MATKKKAVKPAAKKPDPKKAVPAIKKAPSQPGVTKAPPTSSSMNDIAKAKQLFAKSNSDKSGLTDLVKAMGFV